MSNEVDRERRQARMKNRNSTHTSHRRSFDEGRHHKMDPAPKRFHRTATQCLNDYEEEDDSGIDE